MIYRTFLLILLLASLSCDSSVSDAETISDEYYVKYEVNSSTIYTGGKLNVVINTEKNTHTSLVINQRQSWEVIIGPVQKGFNTSLNINAIGNTQDRLTLFAAIYVSKNNSPFALKEIDGSETERDFVQIKYTIDY